MATSQICLIVLILSTFGDAAPQCRDDNGKAVDWYVLYKLPMITDSTNDLLRHGFAYMYVTSLSPDADWTLSSRSINSSTSMPGRTLAPVYTKDYSSLLYTMYNDDPPSSTAGTIYGHTKGVVIAQSTGGLWLIHSVPNYPLEPVSPETSKLNQYQYPSSGLRYGQSFLCITLPSNQMDFIGKQFLFNRPKFYSKNVPESLQLKYPNLTLAASGTYKRDAPYSNIVTLKSSKGVTFTSYAKSSGFEKDLYSDLVALDLQDDLQVEAWSNGAGAMPSDCRDKYFVMDVKELAFKVNSTAISFKNSNDHSKWAVTASAGKNIVCIGDINRMAAQLKRGGGTVCVQQPSLWSRYTKAIVDVDPCPANSG